MANFHLGAIWGAVSMVLFIGSVFLFYHKAEQFGDMSHFWKMFHLILMNITTALWVIFVITFSLLPIFGSI